MITPGLNFGLSKSVQQGGLLNVYIFEDSFDIDEAAPIFSPRASGLAVVDTANKVSITDGKLKFSALTVANSDPRAYSPALERIPGRALYCKFKGHGYYIGIDNTTTSYPHISLKLRFDSQFEVYNFASTGLFPFVETTTEYELLIVNRGNLVATNYIESGGYLMLIKGGVYTNWTIIGISQSIKYEPFYVSMVSFYNMNAQITDDWKVIDLGGAFARHYSHSIVREAYPYSTANDKVYVITANGIAHLQWRCATGNAFDVQVRRVDDNNCWIVRFAQAGTVKIIEKVEGTETERATANITFNNATNHQIRIRLNAQVIRVNVNDSTKVEYTSAATNETATGCKVTGTFAGVYNFSYWPLTIADFEVKKGINQPKFILPYGDSKTVGYLDDAIPVTGGGYPPILMDLLDTAQSRGYYERPLRIAQNGRTTALAKAAVDAELAAAVGTPDYILYNLGANDTDFDATWHTNTAYILDALHAKWPNAKIYMAVTWERVTGFAYNLAHRAAINTAIAGRSYCYIGIDELTLENGDDGATYFNVDGTHPNRAGYIKTAQLWKAVLGL